MTKLDRVFLFLLALSIGLLILLLKERKELKDELIIQLSNLETLKEESIEFSSKLGKSTSQCKLLQIERDELKRVNTELADGQSSYQKSLSSLKKAIKDLEIKESRVEEASVVHSESTLEVESKVSDADSIKSFSWKDNYVEVVGSLFKDSVKCRVSSVDTLVQLIERVPKRFLFIRYGTKYIKQSIQSMNPHTKIVYSNHLKLR